MICAKTRQGYIIALIIKFQLIIIWQKKILFRHEYRYIVQNYGVFLLDCECNISTK